MNSLSKPVKRKRIPTATGNIRISLIEIAWDQDQLDRLEQAYQSGDVMRIGILIKDQIDIEIDQTRGAFSE